MMRLQLSVRVRDEPDAAVDVCDPQLVVAGYTGRNQELVQQHIAELEAEGVPSPAAIPMYWLLPSWLLATGGELDVSGARTSGEAEPVLVSLPDGQLFVGVGSDHTDRELEQVSLHAAKQACPKVVAREVWPFDDVASGWDDLFLRSHYDGDERPYQEGTLALLRPAKEMLEAALDLVDRRRPLVLFLGTVPLVDGRFRYGSTFAAELMRGNDLLRCSYSVRTLSLAPISA